MVGNSSADGYGRAVGRSIALGSSIVPNSGRSSIALGSSAAAMVATTFLRTVSSSILAVDTGFASTAAP